MKTFPADAIPYKKTHEFTETTIPRALLKDHSTKAGVWGKIIILEGSLLYYIGDAPAERLTPERYGVVEPEVLHRVGPDGDGSVRFFVHFHSVE